MTFCKRSLLEREALRAVGLLMVAPVITGVFFRPEEDGLISIIVNDVCSKKSAPIYVRFEKQWERSARHDPEAQMFIDLHCKPP